MTTTPTVWKNPEQANTQDGGVSNDDQTQGRIIQLANGNILVLWTDNSDVAPGDTAGQDVVGQIFDPQGVRVGGEIRVSGNWFANDERAADIGVLPNGGFVAVFERDEGAGVRHIYSQTWNANGTSSSADTIVSDPGADQIGDPSIEVNADGSYWVFYQQTGAGGALARGVLVSSTGVVGSPTTLISGSTDVTDGGQQIESARLNDGNLVIVERHNGADASIAYRIISPTGVNVMGASFLSGTNSNGTTDTAPAVAALTGGGFVVVWQNAGVDTDLALRVFNAAGAALGSQTFPASDGGTDNDIAPAVIGLADGGFFVAWDDNETGAIQGQRFDASGVAVGTRVQIASTFIFSSQNTVQLTMLQDGRIGISYVNSVSFIGTDNDTHFAIYDPRDAGTLTYGSEATAITARIDGSTIRAGGGNDSIYGQAGNDVLHGEGGDDTIRTGAGVDSVYAGDGADTVIANASGGTLVAELGIGNDIFDGSGINKPATVYGEDGLDNLTGSAGDDYLSGGNDVDTINAQAGGKDRLVGGAGDDTMTGDTSDVYFGGDGADTISVVGQTGFTNGYVDAGANGDTVEITHPGIDSSFVIVEGGDGNDTLRVSDQVQNVTVELYGQQGTDTLRGGKGNDWLSGGTESDTLIGGNGSDRLIGGAGIDSLDGGNGDDYLYGGSEGDVFDFRNSIFAGQTDTIRDYEDGLDTILLPASIANVGNTTITQSAFGLFLSVAGTGWGVLIEVPWSTNITIGSDVLFV